MRLVHYIAGTALHPVFTTSYAEALANGGVKGTFLTPIDERTPEEKRRAKAHAAKAKAHFKAKAKKA